MSQSEVQYITISQTEVTVTIYIKWVRRLRHARTHTHTHTPHSRGRIYCDLISLTKGKYAKCCKTDMACDAISITRSARNVLEEVLWENKVNRLENGIMLLSCFMKRVQIATGVLYAVCFMLAVGSGV